MIKNLPLSKIKVGERLRQDLGDIQSLADSIEEVGLLHPIVIDQKGKLIAGRRRLAAVKLLEWDTVDCNVIDIDDVRIGEVHENQSRKNFTASEIAAIADYVESEKKPGKPAKGADSAPLPRGKTREVTANVVGVSHNTVDKIRTIVEAARKNPEKYGKILEKVDKGTLSVNSAAVLVTREQRNLPKVSLPKGIFDVIYADPAIRFNNRSIRGSADNNYETMEIEDIARGIFNGENVRHIIAENAVMFMWFPSSILFYEIVTTIAGVAISVPAYKYILNSWGFDTIKTDFVWDKKIIGPGTYSKNQHETLIMAIKGEMPTPAERFSSIHSEQRTQTHSQKPIHFYEMIEQMYPQRKYVELWARPEKRRPHWTYFGNQVEEITA